MAGTTSFNLGEHYNEFLTDMQKSGRYSSASEVIRDALRLLEEREANSKLEALRQALIEGEESGDAGELDMQAVRAEARKNVGLD